jgi:hypothetical protein
VVGVDWAFHLAVFLSFFLSLSLLFVSDGVWSLYGVDVVGYAVCHLSFAREKEGAESEIAARAQAGASRQQMHYTAHIKLSLGNAAADLGAAVGPNRGQAGVREAGDGFSEIILRITLLLTDQSSGVQPTTPPETSSSRRLRSSLVH